jgi:hypothetical protein
MNTTSIAIPPVAALPVILCNVPGTAGKRPIAALSPFALRTDLVRLMSASPGAFKKYRAALPPIFPGWQLLPAYSVREQAQYVSPYDSGYVGTPFGDAIAAEARRRDSESVIPWPFYFPEFGDRIVVVIPAPRSPRRWKRLLRRQLVWVYRELAAAFEAANRRED